MGKKKWLGVTSTEPSVWYDQTQTKERRKENLITDPIIGQHCVIIYNDCVMKTLEVMRDSLSAKTYYDECLSILGRVLIKW